MLCRLINIVKFTMLLKSLLLVCCIILSLSNVSFGEFLRLQGQRFFYGDKPVFLSGANIAWHNYGTDFGNGDYATSGPILEQWIRDISTAGGNSLSEF